MKAIINANDPYGEILSGYFQREFPEVSTPNAKELFEILTNIIVGTKDVRYGPIPIPEFLVTTRKAISYAIANDMAIPILVPWGSIKANFSSTLDIGEVSALRGLIELNLTVKRFYKKGLEIVIRVEDLSGYTLFSLEGDQNLINQAIDKYSADLSKLVTILSPDKSLRTSLETSMENANKFQERFAENSIVIENYLQATKAMILYAPDQVTITPEYRRLQELGWKGTISFEQREHYISTYKKVYQDWNEDKHIKRLAMYLGGSLTRHQLKMTGVPEYWKHFILLSFTPPIKGLPEGYNANYIYYRTLPASQARTHISPWRGKSYFKIYGNNLCPKMTSWNDYELIAQLIPSQVQLSNEKHTVTIQTDYIVES